MKQWVPLYISNLSSFIYSVNVDWDNAIVIKTKRKKS